MGDLPEPDGGAATGDDTVSPLKWTPPDSSLPSIGPESFKKAEKSVQKIIFKVLPTAVSEERRHKLIDYLQRLLKTSVGCEVRIPFEFFFLFFFMIPLLSFPDKLFGRNVYTLHMMMEQGFLCRRLVFFMFLL